MRTQPRGTTVVGASAAGLFVAAELAAAGEPVRVIERAARFDPLPRTLIATSRLRDVLGPLADNSVVNEIRNFELYADGVVASISLRRPDVIVERSALLRDLAGRARDAGAEMQLGQAFIAAEPTSDGLTVSTRDVTTNLETRRASSTVVGADGALSSVARDAGWGQQETVPLVQALVEVPETLPSDTVRVWFRPDETSYFYWLIPEGDGRAVVGLIGEHRHAIRPRLDAFLREKRLSPLGYQAARIPLYRGWRSVHRRLGNGAVYLVGDAAGHVKSSTVGGLVTGFRGARAVADRILGRRSTLMRSLRVELDLHDVVRRLLGRFGEDDYRRLFQLIQGSEHRLLSAYTRDETSRLLWRLAVREPRLGLVALRALVGRAPSTFDVPLEPAAQSSALT